MTGTWRAVGIAIAVAKAKLEADATSWLGFLDKGETASMAQWLYVRDIWNSDRPPAK